MAQRSPALKASTGFDVSAVRRDFAILEQPLVYFDNAASKQRPRQVLAAMDRFYETSYANVHRSLHRLGHQATQAFESVREQVRAYINAAAREEIIFTKGATEAINLVASSYGQFLKAGDRVVLTVLEHHSNIVPWQLLRERTGVEIDVIDIDASGQVDLAQATEILSKNPKLVSFAHISNGLGIELPVRELVSLARQAGAVILIDGCQAMASQQVDVRALDCDFYVLSAHKMYGPTGIGILYGRKELLEIMPPYQGGGEMIDRVTFEKTTYADLPYKFEAGTPPIAEVIGLGAAIDYLELIDHGAVSAHLEDLTQTLAQGLRKYSDISVLGEDLSCGIVSFIHARHHPQDIAQLLDEQGICVRAGHHCNQPLMDRLGISGTVRVSLGIYNTAGEIERFFSALDKTLGILG